MRHMHLVSFFVTWVTYITCHMRQCITCHMRQCIMCHIHHMHHVSCVTCITCHGITCVTCLGVTNNMRHVVTCVTYHSVTYHMRHVSRCHMSRCHGRVQWSQGGVKQCRVWWRLECKTCSKFKTSVNSVLGPRHAVSYSWRLHTNADFTVKCQLHSSTRSVQQHSDCTAQELHSLMATAQPYSDFTAS